MSALFFRHAFSDYHSLRELERGTVPSTRDLRRRLFVLERRLDPRRPDHFYHAYLDDRFASATSLGQVARLVLHAMAERFLVLHPAGVFVRAEAFSDWQSAVGLLSPLAVATCAIGSAADRSSAIPVEELVRSRLGTTACRGPLLPAVEDLIATDGLNDLHMHLNGSTEIDVIWEDVARHPDAYQAEFAAPYESRETIRELYDQIEDGLTTGVIHRRLKAARRGRQVVARAIRDANGGIPVSRLGVATVLKALAVDAQDADVDVPGVYLSDPPLVTINGRPSDLSALEREAAFLLCCFDAMARLPDHAEAIGVMLWHNFTVFSQIARLAVHQFDQSGFHQFNKTVQSGIREPIERSYEARFHQLNGAHVGGDIAYIDGRFAPKADPEKTAEIVASIVDGLLDYRACPERSRGHNLRGLPPPCLVGPCGCSHRTDRLDLALVAHFIKLPHEVPDERESQCDIAPGRHLKTRAKLAAQSRALRAVLERSHVAKAMIRGIDGAGNELDAPPEVFAPTFRAMRRGGLIPGATYHVGEDFLHLASGVRAVEEAVRFLDLRAGDRVGHAIALGVEPEFWIDRVGDRILVPREQILDDAVYALSVLQEHGHQTGDEGRLTGRIEALSRELYGHPIVRSELERAWSLRHLDFAELLDLERTFSSDPLADPLGFVRHIRLSADESLDEARAAERLHIADAAARDPVAFALYRRRHDSDFIRRGSMPLEIAIGNRGERPDYSIETLCALQSNGIALLNRRQIVIEAMPTSNVRINAYRDYEEHHLMRWIGVAGTPLAERPILCLGSDDPGIFTTNARNEFGHVYLALARHVSSTSAIQCLRDLNIVGRSHRFRARPIGT